MSSKPDKRSAQPAQPAQQFPGQHEGEAVEMLFRQHPLVMRKTLIFGLLVILVGVVPLDFPVIYNYPTLQDILVKIALILPIFVLVAWVYRWILWYYTVYIVTDRRILEIKQRGMFAREVNEWQLDAIMNVNYKIGGFQAVLFGFGDIMARSYIGDLEMKTIHKPIEVHGQLLEAVKRAGGGKDGGGSTQLPSVT